MGQTSRQWFDDVTAQIAREGHRSWPVQEWMSWPFDADGGVRELQPPAEAEPPRHGEGGVGCRQCELAALPDPREYLAWRDDLWMLGTPFEGTSLPFLAFLMPRRHADLSEITSAEAARMGELQVQLERAVTQVLPVPRVQLCRWGDGSEHLHWWVFGRPTGVLQLRGTFLSHWDDLLPARDPAQLRADVDAVAARLVELAGGEALPGSSA